MSQPYIGEIRMFAGSFAPAGWMTCDGQLLPISDYQPLYTLIGTTYGGDGQSTFALPSLAARVPIHMGSNGTSTYALAQNGGVTSVALSVNQMPLHSHPIVADSGTATTSDPTNAYFADASPKLLYTVPNGPNTPDPPVFHGMNAAMLSTQGGGLPHDNMQPYLTITYIIALFGVVPSTT
ncbi:MAG TPA: tail fiber protein [Candidatus Limnocylindria bacterium]|jgi:microcystin-dependent protein|nr:tail fiber protein [Candidatus Limnocylindria bacterium]